MDMQKGKDVQKDEDVKKGKDVEKDEDVKLKTWQDSTFAMLSRLDDYGFEPFSISVVPDELRKWNENAYKPKVVSIGPRYKGATRDLQQMEEIKWRCMLILLYRTPNARKSLDICMNAILALDGMVRASYVDEIKLDRYELASIMLNDSCFLLELLIRGSWYWNRKLESRLPDLEAGVGKLEEEETLIDLTLLENQIPLFLLNELATLLFPKAFATGTEEDINIKKLIESFLGFHSNSSKKSNNSIRASHFLELAYSPSFDVKSPDSKSSDQKVIDVKAHDVNGKLNRCATVLQAFGITISRSANISGINFNKDSGILEIPRLDITKTTEAKLRNFIAWEHHKMKAMSYHSNNTNQSGLNYICKYTGDALFFQGLVCSASDVQLLIDKQVIVNHSTMSNQDLVTLFHSITIGVDSSIIDSNYANIFDLLNKYRPRPFTYATLIPTRVGHHCTCVVTRYYLRWKRGYNIAISIISLLTLVQTVYAVLSYHNSKK